MKSNHKKKIIMSLSLTSHINTAEFGFVALPADFDPHTTRDDGKCVEENSQRLALFWKRGWTDCVGQMVGIVRETDKQIIFHFNILNKKNNKIIDVANGFMKMVDYDAWCSHNNPLNIVEYSVEDLTQQLCSMGSRKGGLYDKIDGKTVGTIIQRGASQFFAQKFVADKFERFMTDCVDMATMLGIECNENPYGSRHIQETRKQRGHRRRGRRNMVIKTEEAVFDTTNLQGGRA